MKTYIGLDKAKIRAELEKMVFPADVIDALPRWREVEFKEPQPAPAPLAEAPAGRGRPRKKPAA